MSIVHKHYKAKKARSFAENHVSLHHTWNTTRCWTKFAILGADIIECRLFRHFNTRSLIQTLKSALLISSLHWQLDDAEKSCKKSCNPLYHRPFCIYIIYYYCAHIINNLLTVKTPIWLPHVKYVFFCKCSGKTKTDSYSENVKMIFFFFANKTPQNVRWPKKWCFSMPCGYEKMYDEYCKNGLFIGHISNWKITILFVPIISL